MEAKAASANGRAVRSIPSTVRCVSVSLKSAMKRGPTGLCSRDYSRDCRRIVHVV